MADKIKDAKKVKIDDVTEAYQITYELEKTAKPEQKQTVSVVVNASEMADPEDADEAKTLANTTAKEHKKNLDDHEKIGPTSTVELETVTVEDVPEIVGDVDLQP